MAIITWDPLKGGSDYEYPTGTNNLFGPSSFSVPPSTAEVNAADGMNQIVAEINRRLAANALGGTMQYFDSAGVSFITMQNFFSTAKTRIIAIRAAEGKPAYSWPTWTMRQFVYYLEDLREALNIVELYVADSVTDGTYLHSVGSLASDGTYIYAGSTIYDTVTKIRISDMTVVDSILNATKLHGIRTLVYAGGYIYVSTTFLPTRGVVKIRTSDMTIVDEVQDLYLGAPYEMDSDGTYLYVNCLPIFGDPAYQWTGRLTKVRMSDLAIVDTMAQNLADLQWQTGITISGEYAYLVMDSNTISHYSGFVKIRLSDLVVVAVSTAGWDSNLQDPSRLAADDTYGYVTSFGNDRIYKIALSDLSFVDSLEDTINLKGALDIVVYNENVYIGASLDNRVTKVAVGDLSGIADTVKDNTYLVQSWRIITSGDYAYVSCPNSDRVTKVGGL